MKIILICLLTIFTFSFLLTTPLLREGLYTMHDDQQVARLYLYDEALRTGQFPPRWVSTLGFGFGYPLFIFYPPLVYIVGELFHLAGFGFIDSIKIVFFLSILLSGFSMFVLAKYLFGNFAAVIGSIFYILVPYRALDVYVRGALAESFSFVWPPIIIWALLKIYKEPNINNSLVTAVLLSALMLTHNLIFLSFMLILALLIFLLIFFSKNKSQFILYVSSTLILSALMSAFFWIPALVEKKFTIVDQLLIVNLASYKIHFVYPTQLWNWTWGFGGSTAGIMDGISFKIGKLHIIISILAMAISTIYLSLKSKLTGRDTFIFRLTILFFTLFVFSAFMTTYYSKLIWDLIKPLAYLQFPWRFLAFTALFSSILASAFIYALKLPVIKLSIGLVLVILLGTYNFKLFKPQYYRTNLTDEVATSNEVISWDVSSSSFEYVPKGMELVKNEKGANSLSITRADLPKEKISVTEGQAKIYDLYQKPGEVKFTAEVLKKSKITINSFDFPGWHLFVNGQENEYSSNNKFKLITTSLDEGTSHVKLTFKNTPIRFAANIISAVSFLLLMVYLSKRWLTRIIKLI